MNVLRPAQISTRQSRLEVVRVAGQDIPDTRNVGFRLTLGGEDPAKHRRQNGGDRGKSVEPHDAKEMARDVTGAIHRNLGFEYLGAVASTQEVFQAQLQHIRRNLNWVSPPAV